MVATDPFQYVPSKSCRCSAEGVGATLFIFKQPWHRPFSEAKKSVPTPQMSREPLCTTRAFLGICAFLYACPWRNTSIYRTVARGKVFERRGRVQCKRGCRAFRGAAYLPRGVETVFLHVPLLHLDIHVAYIILFSFSVFCAMPMTCRAL